jgi:MFS family permease
MSYNAHDHYQALRFRDFRFLLIDDVVRSLGGQMLHVAIGWEMYNRTNSALALGLIGLAQLVPLLVLAPLTGHIADRYNRKHVVILAQCVGMLTALGFAALSYWHSPVVALYGCLLVMGIGEAFHDPASHALLANVIPADAFENAAAWSNGFGQLASIVGPALGGLIVATVGGATAAYVLNALAVAMGLLMLCGIRARPHSRPASAHAEEAPTMLRALGEGLRFVRRTPVLFAALALDLFAVLFGGAEALLPVFARDILRVGPTGLGLLQAAPAVGALCMTGVLAYRPRLQHAGIIFLAAVAGFGLVMIGFGLSRVFWLSLLLLGLFGALDSLSMVIRDVLMLSRTPDAMRGRVAAIEGVFTGSSNQLGGLESGVTAQLFGPVASVVVGGLATLGVVLAVASLSPALRQMRTLVVADSGEQCPAQEEEV